MLHAWVEKVRPLYHGIDINTTNIDEKYADAVAANHWSLLRFKHMINLRQAALDEARKTWADYIFVSCYWHEEN
jgi:collagen beta-1,O-galactosyltransferase